MGCYQYSMTFLVTSLSWYQRKQRNVTQVKEGSPWIEVFCRHQRTIPDQRWLPDFLCSVILSLLHCEQETGWLAAADYNNVGKVYNSILWLCCECNCAHLFSVRGEIYDLYCSSPPISDQNVLASMLSILISILHFTHLSTVGKLNFNYAFSFISLSVSLSALVNWAGNLCHNFCSCHPWLWTYWDHQ